MALSWDGQGRQRSGRPEVRKLVTPLKGQLMNTLKPGPLASEIIPGAFAIGLFLLLWRFAAAPYYRSWLFQLANTEGASSLLKLGGAVALAWIIGTFIDAFRNGCVEGRIDTWRPQAKIGSGWNFFFGEDPAIVAQFDQYYFSPYRLDANAAIAIIMVLGLEFLLQIFQWLRGIVLTHYSLDFFLIFHFLLLVFLSVFVKDGIAPR